MVRNLLALTGVIAIGLVSAATLQAQGYFDDPYDSDPPLREAVSTRGLDLASPEGIEQLEDRINAAIGRVCPDDGGRSLRNMRSVRECREDAVASVRPQVDRAVAAAEDRQYRAYRAPGRWRHDGPPPPDRYAMRAPAPDHAWRGEDERGWREDRPEFQWRGGERPRVPAAAPKSSLAKAVPPPAPAGRLVKRTVVTTTTVTTTTGGRTPPPPAVVEKTVTVKRIAAAKAVSKSAWRAARSPAYARRTAVAGSWLPPVAWAASDQAAIRAFRTGKPAHWRLTDRDGIARSGHVSVGAPRWVGGCACRSVQTVKYHGRKQIVVASGMRCLDGRRLVNRAA